MIYVFKSDTTTIVGILTMFLTTYVLSTFHNSSVTWCMDDWENRHEFYLWMHSTLNLSLMLGFYQVTISYQVTGNICSSWVSWDCMEPTLENFLRKSCPTASYIFHCLIIWLSVLVHNSPQIITVECVKYHMGILYFSVVVIHYLMFVPFWNPSGCVQSTTKSQCDWVNQGLFRWIYCATLTLLDFLGFSFVLLSL